jgi:hypothetical protein
MADLDGHVTTPMLIRSREGCPTAIKDINSFDKLTQFMHPSLQVMSMIDQDELVCCKKFAGPSLRADKGACSQSDAHCLPSQLDRLEAAR